MLRSDTYKHHKRTFSCDKDLCTNLTAYIFKELKLKADEEEEDEAFE